MLELSLTILLTFLAIAAWGASVLGMPGNWLIVAMSAACWWFCPEESRNYVAVAAICTIVIVAIVGEVLEFLAGALGANRMGGSRRGTVLAMGGSIAGAIAGLFLGTAIPIPIIGNLIGSVLLGGVGAFAGALAGERWAGKDWDTSIEIGSAAFWGRLLGTVAKAVCGTIVCFVFLTAIWW